MVRPEAASGLWEAKAARGTGNTRINDIYFVPVPYSIEGESSGKKGTLQTITGLLVLECHGMELGHRAHLWRRPELRLPECRAGSTWVMADSSQARLAERSGA